MPAKRTKKFGGRVRKPTWEAKKAKNTCSSKQTRSKTVK